MKIRPVALAILFLLCADAHSLTRFQEIASPAGCPENLQITSAPDEKNSSWVIISVRFKPREPDLYKGRVTAGFGLLLLEGDRTLLKSELKTSVKDGFTRARFRIHRAALAASQLNVSSHLHEKDGLPTVGGGVFYRVRLSGWAEGKGGADGR